MKFVEAKLTCFKTIKMYFAKFQNLQSVRMLVLTIFPTFFYLLVRYQACQQPDQQVDRIFKCRPGVNITNVLLAAFMLVDPESVKNTVKSSVSFYAYGICSNKSCTNNIDEIEPGLSTCPVVFAGACQLKSRSTSTY